MVKIGIIGTAGRKEDGSRMSKELYEKMKILTYRLITHIESDLSKIELFSGGAAWSDHLAVNMYLEHQELKLTLCLPCQWDTSKSQYIDTGEYDYRINPGKTSNYYHKKFSDKMEQNTLKEIDTCIQKGADVKIEDGFHARNNLISQNVDFLIAFTWGLKQPKDGGTLNTWQNCPSSVKKVHISLEMFNQ